MSGDTNDICGDKANEPVPDMLQHDTDQKTEDAVSQSPKKPDQLAEALKYIARVHGYHVTDSVIWNGLPKTQDTLTIGILSRAAANCGLKILPDKKDLDAIPLAALPCIVATKHSEMLVLTAINFEGGTVELASAEYATGTLRRSLDDFLNDYSGYAIFVQPSVDKTGVSERTLGGQGHWFWSTISSYWRDYAHVALAALLINLLALASPLFTMNVYDRVVPNFAIPTLWALAIGVILTLIFDFILKVARGQIINVAGKQADNELASKVFAHALAIDFEKRPVSSGQFANHIREFETVREFITSSSLVSIIDVFFIGIFVAVLFLLVGPIAIVPLIAIPIVLGISLLVQAPLSGAIEKSHNESAIRHSILVESIANLDTVRALNAEGRMQTKWERSVAASSAAIMTGRFWALIAQSGTGLVQASVSIGIIVWGVYLISSGDITMGALIAAMMLSGRVLAPLANVANTLTRLRQTMHSFKILNEIMQTETERKPGRTYINKRIASGSVEFKGVSFRYPEAEDDSLKNISFKIAPGETVGLIGRVGSGKSTIGRLTSGLYYPSNGAVLIDGTDTRQFDPADLRSNVGFLSQDNVLFSGTVRENISAGDPFADDDALIQAARTAGVDEFVAQNPLGYDLQVGEGGRFLSGGQKQAVALARILLRKPRVLFLDEPSSHLDLASERRLIARLNENKRADTTVIISTHRMSLVELTDRLITLDYGKLALDGPRQDVLKKLQELGAVNNQNTRGTV
ncbi:type I secretion system permease/ATPase [uncultured Roseibium sp.]|uniref:type I secretion system permease/ATPase n=1 Tax=uncultured Roseibium sp. TaxID=1936171 RepID=UPI00260A665B|nr:type I secretion system permease/ATPase [uncultured Roseibium sp.]